MSLNKETKRSACVEEVLYVTDMDATFAAAGAVRKEAYGIHRRVALAGSSASSFLITSSVSL